MSAPIEFNGPLNYRLRNLGVLLEKAATVTASRLAHGPHLPGWAWRQEITNEFLRAQNQTALELPTIAAAREYLDALVLNSSALARVTIEEVDDVVHGHWYRPQLALRAATILYFHGGSYAYNTRSNRSLIAQIALAARAPSFALDYRLVPEHAYPAQLEDALTAYQWLLDHDITPAKLILAGDAAGGNLLLALLLSLRDHERPMPSMGLCLSPWTDVQNLGASMVLNEPHDWNNKGVLDRCAELLCREGCTARDPLISPVAADLRGLPPLYIQAGGAEILYDMICAFAEHARAEGVHVTFDSWPNMPHDFQSYGDLLPASGEALARIGQTTQKYVR